MYRKTAGPNVMTLIFGGLLLSALTGCATAPLESAGSLASYQNLTQSDGTLTHSKLRVDKKDVLAAHTVSVVPTAFSASASQAELTDKQRLIISNAVNRSLCLGLSERFQIVPPGQPAELTVRALVTNVKPTNAAMSGVSNAVALVPSFFSLGYPVPVPRIPIGMGTLSLEAEARDNRGVQKAAMIWARGADSVTSKARVSAAGDPYELASAFGDDFSKLLVTGESPFEKKIPTIPSMDRLSSTLGGKPKEAACEAFGREGIAKMIGGRIGLPPEWTDDGPPAPATN
jgi:Protein of unknown function (DUF3313)